MTQSPKSSNLTSIIVVTYNRLDDTKRCVGSVVAHTPEPHELVFVDNASSDGTGAYLRERFGHDAVIAKYSNEGFLRAANMGISVARGRYLLLLNNDTIVTDGWLSALLRAAEASPDTGIVGGKIMGPDRRVQVAGAYMAFDGSARMIGEGLDQDHPSISHQREVCYIGGHCMLIKREVIDRVGPLNEEYGFGYHEDTDYCYRAREEGYKTVYTPKCVVYHQLHGTPLADRQSLIFENQRRFMKRWGDKLFLHRFIGRSIDFSVDSAELPVGAGWFAAEPDYTYMNREAWFYLQAPEQPTSALELVAFAPHPDLLKHPLRLEIRVEGSLIGLAFFRTPWETQRLFFPVPELSGPNLRVELSVDRTWRPDDLFENGVDSKEIGLGVKRVAIGSFEEATERAKESTAADESMERLRDHLSFLQDALEAKDDFYRRELEGKEQLIAALQANLERYHATPPFRMYFAIKRLMGRF